MSKKNCQQEELDNTNMSAVKQEFIMLTEDYCSEMNDALDLHDLIETEDDPLKINEEDRDLIIKQENLEKEPQVVLATRGGPGLVYQGYLYNKCYIYKHKQVIRWRCKRSVKACRGTLDTDIKCKVARVQEEHNHPPDYVATEAAKLKCNQAGHRVRNFFRKDGTFMIPYKENAKKKIKNLNPYGIQNTLHCWTGPVKTQTIRSQTSM